MLQNVLIDSGATCNLVDQGTWETLKSQNVVCTSKASDKTLFAYGQSKPIETLGTFRSVIYCKDTDRRCVDEFTVIKGEGNSILGKTTAERLNVLRVGPPTSDQVCSIVCEGKGTDFVKSYPEVFSGVGKLNDFQLKLHVNRDIKPIAQNLRRVPYSLREIVDKKLDRLLELDVIEEVPEHTASTWVSPLVCIPKKKITMFAFVLICVGQMKPLKGNVILFLQ